MQVWKWKYFTRDEIACKGDNSILINEDALNKLERMREIMGVPLKINSAFRSAKHNHKVGGADNSMHRQGKAFDVALGNHDPAELYQSALKAGFTGFGFYRTFLHVDTGASRWWGKYRKQYASLEAKNLPAPKSIVNTKQVLSFVSGIHAKDEETPHKIEGVRMSDNQKIAAVTTTSVAATGGLATIISDPQIITSSLSFLQAVDWRVAIAVLVAVGLFIWLRGRK